MELIVVRNSPSFNQAWKSMQLIDIEFDALLVKLSETYKIKYIYINELYQISSSDVKKMSDDTSQIIYYVSGINVREAINLLIEKRPNATHNFAIFGNILSNPRRLKEYVSLLKKQKIRFLYASETYKNFAQQFFIGVESAVLPFSINQKFSFGVDNKKWDFIYAGRLNSAKGIFTLINLFSKPEFSQYRLALAGEIDDQSYPLCGLKTDTDAVKKLIENLPENIVYLGNLNQDELNLNLKNSKCFLYLSTFTSEDFGYAPLQALYNGCDLILSHWGGLKQFQKYSQVRYLPVTEIRGHFTILENQLEMALRNYFDFKVNKEKVCDYDRMAIYHKWLKVLQNSPKNDDLKSISKLFHKYIDAYIEFNRKPFSDENNNGLHQLIFQNFK